MLDQNSQPTDAPRRSAARKAIGYALKYGVPLVITIGLCYLLFADMDFGQMMDIIRTNCDFRWIALTLVISVFSHIFRAMRWRIQLKALGIDAPLFALVLSIFGTYAVNLVFPRLGEIWRTGYIAQRQRAPFTTVFGSMVADRLADTVTVALLTAITFVFAGRALVEYLGQSSETLLRIKDIILSPYLIIGVVAVIAATVYLLRRHRDSKIVGKLRQVCSNLWEGFAVIAKMPGLGRWLGLTVCIWGCYFGQLFVAFFSFPATAEVVSHYGVIAVLVCFVFSSISMGVPSNGGIGPWQWAIIFGLMLYSKGIPELTRDYATSFANLVMGTQTLLLIVLGLFTFVTIALSKRRDKTN